MTAQVEVWVLVDADGDYVAHHDADQLADMYANDIGNLTECNGYRVIKVALTVPLPAVIELSGVVRDDGKAELVQAK